MKALRLAVLIAAATAISTSAFAQGANEGRRKVVPPTPKQQEKIFPTGTSWTAVSLSGRPIPSGVERPSFSLDSQFRARGFGGCNTYSATVYPLRNQTLAVGPIALTKRKCPGNLNAAEQNFLGALRSAQKWDIIGSTLIMKTGHGDLRFQRSL
ncbi:META domain-containing protein [Microvirga sp. W0021]|uniref:META domain-containing protein n=1 Tax=Hohaiivirga grylli TaxID=3133970 RepID=A0ABV0BHP3_9HYPH